MPLPPDAALLPPPPHRLCLRSLPARHRLRGPPSGGKRTRLVPPASRFAPTSLAPPSPLGHTASLPGATPLPQSPPGLGRGAPGPPEWVPALLSGSGSVVGDLSPKLEWGVGWQVEPPPPLQCRNPGGAGQVKGRLRRKSNPGPLAHRTGTFLNRGEELGGCALMRVCVRVCVPVFSKHLPLPVAAMR